jgi:G3E family GTPase
LQKIPVTLLTGFLGSGKTTVLNQLVRQPELANTIVIINEFGEIPIDHFLVAHSTENLIMDMSSGCLCCAIRGDLVKTLRSIHWRFSNQGQRRFNRVMIETTGLADPVPIIQTLMTDPQLTKYYQLDGIISTIDLSNAQHTLDHHIEARKQAAMADCLILTKADLVSTQEQQIIQNRLFKLNIGANRHLIMNGHINAKHLLNLVRRPS